MGKANPKAWFPGWTARISYKSVDKFARQQERFKPFFPSWREAHAWMLKRADDRVAKAKAELKSATAHLAKVKAMRNPERENAGATESVQASTEAGFTNPLVLIWVAAVALVVIALTATPSVPEPQPAPTPNAGIAYVPYVFIDDATGCHYLSTHNSTGLAPRIARDGKSHLGCKGDPK